MEGHATTSSNNNNVATTLPFAKPFQKCYYIMFSLYQIVWNQRF